MGKQGRHFGIEVKGSGVSPMSGSVASDFSGLIKEGDKNIKRLLFEVLEETVKQMCQAGKVEEALEAIKTYQEKQFEYACPLLVFRRDKQTHDAPYVGAHMVWGAIHEAMKRSFGAEVGLYKKGKTGGVTHTELAHHVKIQPHHILLYRPDGNVIFGPDRIDDQLPSPEVRGFTRYEVIEPPFKFMFSVLVDGCEPFPALADADLIQAIIKRAKYHGLGSRRAAGFGDWEIEEMKVVD